MNHSKKWETVIFPPSKEGKSLYDRVHTPTKFCEANRRRFVYVIVRTDMPARNAVVQGSHAVYELAALNKHDLHPSIIYLKVKNEYQLNKLSKLLDEQNTFHVKFVENYGEYKDQTTALCTQVLWQDDGRIKLLKKYRLFNAE